MAGFRATFEELSSQGVHATLKWLAARATVKEIRTRAGIFSLLIALTSPLAVHAQDDFGGRALKGPPGADGHWLTSPRETLKGIRELGVVIETLKPAAQAAGLSIEVLESDVKQQLKRARITVRDMPTPLMQKAGARSATDIVYVKVGSVLPEGSESIVYSVNVEAKQIVTLDRLNARIRGTTTWESGMLGIVGLASSSRKFARKSANTSAVSSTTTWPRTADGLHRLAVGDAAPADRTPDRPPRGCGVAAAPMRTSRAGSRRTGGRY